MTDDDLRRMWREAGGNFHGPRVETGTMPESKLLLFLRGLAAQRGIVESVRASVGSFANATGGDLAAAVDLISLRCAAAESELAKKAASLTPSPSAGVALTADDDRLLNKALDASTTHAYEIATPPAPVQTASVEAVAFWQPWRISHVLADCATYFRTLYKKHNIGPANRGIDPDKLDEASKVAASLTAPTQGAPEPGRPDYERQSTLIREFVDRQIAAATPSSPVSSPSPAGGVEALETTEGERKWFAEADFIGSADAQRLLRDVKKLLPYRDELLKIAEQVGERSDPFAAWETIAALSSPATGEVVAWQGMGTAKEIHGHRVLLALPNGTVKEGYWGTGRYDRGTRAYRSTWVVGPGLEVEPTQWREMPAHPSAPAPGEVEQ